MFSVLYQTSETQSLHMGHLKQARSPPWWTNVYHAALELSIFSGRGCRRVARHPPQQLPVCNDVHATRHRQLHTTCFAVCMESFLYIFKFVFCFHRVQDATLLLVASEVGMLYVFRLQPLDNGDCCALLNEFQLCSAVQV